MVKQVTVREENFLHKGEDSGWENCYFAVLKFGYAKPPAVFFFFLIQQWMLQTARNKKISEPSWETKSTKETTKKKTSKYCVRGTA